MAVAARRLADAAALPAPVREPARRVRERPEPEAAPRPRPRARRAARPRIGRPLMWIGVIGTLLAGIEKIRAENDGLHAELSRARASGRVESTARSGLGLVDASDKVYLKLRLPE
jgi:hypothetical protein